MRVHGYVLAGGAGARMGFDKARAPWGDVPLAIATLEAVAGVCEAVTLVRRGPPDGLPWVYRDGGSVRVIREPDAGERHPLWGVAMALRDSAGGDRALVVPCDVPLLGRTSLERLIARGGVAGDGTRRHPLVGVFPRAWAGRAEEAAAQGASVYRFGGALPEVVLPAAELLNVTTRDELRASSALALGQRWAGDDDSTLARVALGEARRRAARGILDPDASGRVSSWAAAAGEAP